MAMSFKERPKVAFQGEFGAYSEEAAFKFFGKDVDAVPYKSFAEVFEAVKNGKVDFGIVPVKNSLTGDITENLDLISRFDLEIYGEISHRIRYCLISLTSSDMDSIRFIYSHPQALKQCKRFLEKLGQKVIPTYDTAGSVKMVKEIGIRNAVAIASERTAEIYEMKVLESGIEDKPENFTRFFVLRLT